MSQIWLDKNWVAATWLVLWFINIDIHLNMVVLRHCLINENQHKKGVWAWCRSQYLWHICTKVKTSGGGGARIQWLTVVVLASFPIFCSQCPDVSYDISSHVEFFVPVHGRSSEREKKLLENVVQRFDVLLLLFFLSRVTVS